MAWASVVTSASEHLGQPIGIAPERDFAIAAVLPATAHCISIGPGHDPVDLSTKPTLGDAHPPGNLDCQFGVHGGHHLRVGDQVGAIDDRLKRAVIDIASHQHRAHPRQPQPHRPRVVQVTVRQAARDAQRCHYLGGDRVMGVGAPGLALTKTSQPQQVQLADHCQPLPRGPVLGPRRLAELPHH